MANVMEAYLTNAGLTVLNKVLASQGALNFTKAEVGSGKVTGEAACRARTSLSKKTGDATYVRAALSGGQATISVIYDNARLTTGFFVNEIGLYVSDPETGANVLYCYVTFGDYPDWIAPESSATYTRTYDIITIVSNVTEVNVTTSPSTVVSMEDFNNVIAPEWVQSGKYYRGDFVLKSGVLYRCNTDITKAEAWNADHWDRHDVGYYLSRADEINSKPRFGVRGVGLSGASLTRLWDSVGMTATPSTDTVLGSSDFDAYAPFNRRKCVGTWSAGDGKAVFTVNAYEGDADYAEDGSMGDYVAVDVTPFYYIEDGNVIGVSEQKFPGWSIHPVCVDYDGNIRTHTYLPVYALALKDGKAVSLPGYQNEHGDYATLWTSAQTYDATDVATFATLEPSAVDHYEWLLMTIEFATQNMQNIMYGAANMRYDTSDIIVAKPSANNIVVPSAAGAALVIGQTFLINEAHDATVAISNYNYITALAKCDQNGTPDDNGEYYLVTYSGPDRSDSIVINTTKIGSRPWITGATAGYAHGVDAVLGHTGSPISNTNGKYPMRYRWRENVYANQHMTAHDLAAARISEGNDTYHLDWYFNADPRKITTPANFTKAILDDPAKGWTKLSATTPASSYVNGYIRKLDYDERFPHAKVPVLTGGSSTTYYCDYAYLVHTSAVRAVRRRGYSSSGTYAGPRYFNAFHAPSNAPWTYGGELFFAQ